jgi:hypothetical protein
MHVQRLVLGQFVASSRISERGMFILLSKPLAIINASRYVMSTYNDKKSATEGSCSCVLCERMRCVIKGDAVDNGWLVKKAKRKTMVNHFISQ